MLGYDKNIYLSEDTTLGYIYFLDKDHPLSNSQGKIYYHRHFLGNIGT